MSKLRVTVDGKTYDVEVEVLDEGGESAPVPAVSSARVAPPPQRSARKAPESAVGGGGGVVSPLAGKVVTIHVGVGDSVSEGENLITLEAMKMNTFVTATATGTVQSIEVSVGDAVVEGQTLITIG